MYRISTLVIAATLVGLPALAQGQVLSQSPLTPVEAQIRALVSHAQPRASFGAAPDIFYGQFRTENHVFQTRSAARRHQPPTVELGPLPRGFYLQLEVTPGSDAGIQTTSPAPSRPWTTVISTYPLTTSGRMIVMTWEAAPGAPPGLADRIRTLLLHYTDSLK